MCFNTPSLKWNLEPKISGMIVKTTIWNWELEVSRVDLIGLKTLCLKISYFIFNKSISRHLYRTKCVLYKNLAKKCQLSEDFYRKRVQSQISEDGGKSWIHVIILKFSSLWCSQNGLCVLVSFLFQVTNVGASPWTLFIPVNPPPPLDDQVEAFHVGVITGIMNFKVALWLIHTISTFVTIKC